MPVTRFAPSPTGFLHLGHAYSALFAARAAQEGQFLLRIEDIDPVRCKPGFTAGIYQDLSWLGVEWPQPVRRQSDHIHDYVAAFVNLRDRGVVYPCFCTRREIEQEAQGAAQAPHVEDGAVLYPGTCRHLSEAERVDRLEHQGRANWRLDIAAALKQTGPLLWRDRERGQMQAQPERFGDVVLSRKDVPTSYHLSVTVDDHLQGITVVTRGVDLLLSTDIHRLLQALLGYETPDYHHHALLTDETGRRYAKRDQSSTLRSLREQGKTPDDILKLIGL